MQTLTQEIKDQLELYVTDQSEVALNKFNISVIHQAIYTLNYVSQEFITYHFGCKPFKILGKDGSTLIIDPSDKDYITVTRVGSPLVIYHNFDESSITVEDTRIPGELDGDKGWIERVAPMLIDLMEVINSSYVNGIELKLKGL